MNIAWSTNLNKLRWAVALACLAAYGMTVFTAGYIHDDQWIVADNPLLRRGLASIGPLMTTGYWEAVRGHASPVQEYRPLLMLTFLFQRMTTGSDPRPLHAVNLLLHILVCLLFLEVLRKRMSLAASGAAALLFALLPVHTEAVSSLTGRSELLSAALMLASWLLLDRAKPALGGLCFFAALLTKEHSALFPIALALSDWVYSKKIRTRTQALLWSEIAAYAALRGLVLGRPLHAGVPYFAGASRLTALLTVSRFAAAHYLSPSLTGAGLCSDYSRPLIPDSTPASASAWACLAAFSAAAAVSGFFLARRRAPWAFWIVAPSLFLLPTSHLLIPIDTLGAERFLYLPTMGLACLAGAAAADFPVLLALVLPWYLWCTVSRNRVWHSAGAYYEAAIACNPVSARARSGLGAYWLSKGETARGVPVLLRAIELDPALAAPYYNLARAAWQSGDGPQAERLLRQALAREPEDADSLVLLGVVAEAAGRSDEALAALEKAAALMPWDATAQFDLGRHYLLAKQPEKALPHLARFVESAPDDPDAPKTEELLNALRQSGRGSPKAGDR